YGSAIPVARLTPPAERQVRVKRTRLAGEPQALDSTLQRLLDCNRFLRAGRGADPQHGWASARREGPDPAQRKLERWMRERLRNETADCLDAGFVDFAKKDERQVQVLVPNPFQRRRRPFAQRRGNPLLLGGNRRTSGIVEINRNEETHVMVVGRWSMVVGRWS